MDDLVLLANFRQAIEMQPEPLRSWTPEQVRALREAAGLSQEDCARIIGCSTYTWGDYERGRHAPSHDYAMRVAKLLSVLQQRYERMADGVERLLANVRQEVAA